MKFNINDYVRVKLTKHGKKVLLDWVEESLQYFEKMRNYEEISKTFIKPVGKGWYEAQMWQLMQIFGRHMGNGMDICFETNIEIMEKEKV